jgi:hypothetical protein
MEVAASAQDAVPTIPVAAKTAIRHNEFEEAA